jgi:hypothetical protein
LTSPTIKEREQQIGLMRSIYATACKTVFYLGEVREEAAVAFGVLKKIRSIPEPMSTTKLSESDYETHGLLPSESQE